MSGLVFGLDERGLDRRREAGPSSLTERYSRPLREVRCQAAPHSTGPAKMRYSGPLSLSISVLDLHLDPRSFAQIRTFLLPQC